MWCSCGLLLRFYFVGLGSCFRRSCGHLVQWLTCVQKEQGMGFRGQSGRQLSVRNPSEQRLHSSVFGATHYMSTVDSAVELFRPLRI